jgi:hypothetical protein
VVSHNSPKLDLSHDHPVQYPGAGELNEGRSVAIRYTC